MKDLNPPSKPAPLGTPIGNSEKDKNKYVPKQRAPEPPGRIITDKDGKMSTNIPEPGAA